MKRVVLTIFVISTTIWSLTAAAQSSPRPAKIALHPTLNIVAVARGTELTFIDLDTGEIVRTISGFESLGYDLAWDEAGTKLAVTDEFAVKIFHDPLNPEIIEPTHLINYGLAQQSGYPLDFIIWSPDSTRIAIAVGSYLSIWDAIEPRLLFDLNGWLDRRSNEFQYFDLLTALNWISHDELLFSSRNGIVFLYSISDKAVARFAATPFISLESPYLPAMALSRSGSKAAFAETDADMIYIWDFSQSSEYFVPMSEGIFYGDSTVYITALAWRQDDQIIASLGDDRKLYLWDAETGEQYEVISLPDDASIASIAWTHDGTQLIYATVEGEIAFITPENLPQLEAMEAVTSSP